MKQNEKENLEDILEELSEFKSYLSDCASNNSEFTKLILPEPLCEGALHAREKPASKLTKAEIRELVDGLVEVEAWADLLKTRLLKVI